MEFIALVVLAVVIVLVWLFVAMSKEGRAIGLVEGKLAPCPDRPNCICTEYPEDKAHYIKPFRLPEHIRDTSEVVERLKILLQQEGGKLQLESRVYLSATFESKLFGFIDDLEIRIDMPNQTLHIRSASRLGYSDLGVNLKRTERMLKAIETSFTNSGKELIDA